VPWVRSNEFIPIFCAQCACVMTETSSPSLLGYADKLSARPGDTISFKVSSKLKTPFSARLTRSISADPNPSGPGVVEEDASAFFETMNFESREQPFYPGSYAVGQSGLYIAPQESLKLSIRVFPTLETSNIQTLLSIGEIELQLTGEGALAFTSGEYRLAAETPVPLRRWTEVEVEVAPEGVRLKQTPISRDAGETLEVKASSTPLPSFSSVPVIAAKLVEGIPRQHFNGKLEAPTVIVDGNVIAAWDFSKDISTCRAPRAGSRCRRRAGWPCPTHRPSSRGAESS